MSTPPQSRPTTLASPGRPPTSQPPFARPLDRPAVTYGPWPSGVPWGRYWSGASKPATAATIAAIGVAAAVAAISLPLDRAGLGWLVTAFAAGTAQSSA